MKRFYIAIVIASIITLSGKAQQSCGIYSNISDFKQNKISVPANPEFGKKAIRASNFFLRPYIYLKTNSGRKKISMDSIYAIRCYDGNVYRLWNEKTYLLADTGFIKIYSNTSMESVKHRYSRGYRYKTEQVTRYYFSKNYLSPIFPLTVANVRLALLEDESTDTKLIERFPDDKSLQERLNNRFLINEFLVNAKK